VRHLVAGNFANKHRLQRVAKDVVVPFPIRIAKGKKDWQKNSLQGLVA
jgi:hypothetical protein